MLRTALALLLVLGASTAFAADGKVSGKVVVGGKLLAAGRIFFHLDGGQFVGATIKDGAYQVDRVPTGTRSVTIEGNGVPAKFASEKTAGLTGREPMSWHPATKTARQRFLTAPAHRPAA